MTAYVNPPHGNDARAVLDDRARPYKTHAAAQAAIDALPDRGAHTIMETHKEPPAKKRLRRPRPKPEPTPAPATEP